MRYWDDVISRRGETGNMQKKSEKREGYKFILFFAVWALQKVQSTLEGERQESKKNPKKRKEDVAAVPFFPPYDAVGVALVACL